MQASSIGLVYLPNSTSREATTDLNSYTNTTAQMELGTVHCSSDPETPSCSCNRFSQHAVAMLQKYSFIPHLRCFKNITESQYGDEGMPGPGVRARNGRGQQVGDESGLIRVV
eukprot:768020-Hanusia_phi.AAC.2